MTTHYQLKITLDEIQPPIWRRVVVPADISLAALHDVVQIAMGWTNSHLHAFEIDGQRYGRPDHMDGFDDVLDERRHLLGQLVEPRKRFAYEYDFGDSWHHQIVVEKELAPSTVQQVPVCIDGARNCPPEDCGGAFGYVEFLEVLADPNHEDHEHMVGWIGGSFDAEKFDPTVVNAKLATLGGPKRKRTPRTSASRTRAARH